MEGFADDDFGELYADLQLLPAPAPEQEEEEEPEDGDGDELNKDADNVYVGTDSDSDDDLNIILNDDEDSRGFVVATEEGKHLSKNGECPDQLKDELQLVSSNGHGGLSQNGVEGGYHSQFSRPKFMRTRGSMLANNMKASKSMGLTPDCSFFTKGRGSGVHNQISRFSHFDHSRDSTNSMVVQYGSFLPWYWGIYDVNIDKLEEKPWRYPGVDITDYFNFGFNENTWKQYCVSLGQLWQTSMQNVTPVNESAKLNQESTREQIDHTVSGSLLSPSSKCDLPKGRAIQVENSVVERQPSIHVWHPHSLDSDVIIQIKVQESSDNSSGSFSGDECDPLEEEKIIADKNRNNNNSSSEHDGLSKEQVEDVKESEELSVQERNDLIPCMVKDQHPDEVDQNSEDATERLEGEIKTKERVSIDTCSEDSCWTEPELSLGDQDLSLTSYTDNDSEETEDNVHVDNENSHSPLRSPLVHSGCNLKESLSVYRKTSKNIIFNKIPVNIAYYSRNRGPVQREPGHQCGRHVPGSKLKHNIENDNYVSHIRKSSGRDLSSRDHQVVNYRPKERLQHCGTHKRKDVPYNRETKHSCYYGAEKVVDDLVQTAYSEYSDREHRDSFRENANQYSRRNGDDRECFSEQRTLTAYSERSNWHPADGEHHLDDDLCLLSYKESRHFLPKHSSFPAKERDTQRRRMHHKPHFMDRNCDNCQQFDEYEFEFLNRSNRMYSSFADKEMGRHHEKQFPQIDREHKIYHGRGRHYKRPPLVVNTMWSMKDKYLKHTHHQPSYLKYHGVPYTDSSRRATRVNVNFGGCERHKHATNRDSDWYSGYTDATEDDDCISCPIKECKGYTPPSEAPHWTKDDANFCNWHHDELHPEDDTFFLEGTLRHETNGRYGSNHAKIQNYDSKWQHQLNFPRRYSKSLLTRSSKVISRDHCQQAVLRCRRSVDLINREGKSHAKSSRVVCNDRLECVDRGFAKKRAALLAFDDSHNKKATKFDISKSVCDNENQKWLQNLPGKRQRESLDIEEGEIVTEEPHMEPSVSRRDGSEGAALTDNSMKKRKSQNGYNSELHIGNFDSQKILDTLAKMEKRGERFKQPMNMIKEAEKSLKLNADTAVNMSEIKQHRPARKRRWNVS